jgi:hypothetical protein
MTKNTRSWLIGELKTTFSNEVLPTNSEVLSVFVYNHRAAKQTISASYISTTVQVTRLYMVKHG